MSRLVIEYILEGQQRGYNFTTPTQQYDEATLKMIWRQAMPRGQGWNAALYAQARSIKCFPLDTGEVAVSEVTVTDQEDENGRRGIRRAVVDVLSPALFAHHLTSRREGYPASVRRAAAEMYAQVIRTFPKLKKNQPLILLHPFTTPQAWWAMEALVLQLALTPPTRLQRDARLVPFTTLALSYHNEARIIALPSSEATQEINVPVLAV